MRKCDERRYLNQSFDQNSSYPGQRTSSDPRCSKKRTLRRWRAESIFIEMKKAGGQWIHNQSLLFLISSNLICFRCKTWWGLCACWGICTAECCSTSGDGLDANPNPAPSLQRPALSESWSWRVFCLLTGWPLTPPVPSGCRFFFRCVLWGAGVRLVWEMSHLWLKAKKNSELLELKND